LRASRSVVRQALALLKKERLIESFQSKGNRIAMPRKRGALKPERLRTVALLSPASIEDGRPLVSLPIDDFRQQLIKEGCQLQIVASKSCYKKNPEAALASLLAHHRADCWILRLSTKAAQEWFQQQEIPSVILGSCHEGVALPFVDVDRKALARHAVGVMIKGGHRNFVLLINRDGRGGDVECEHGFLEATAEAQKHHSDLRAYIVHHEESVPGLVTQLHRLLAQKSPPTAIFVAQPTFYLTAVCELTRRGWKVPGDISLMTQVGGPYLSFMLPTPASYHVNSQKFTRKLLGLVLATINRDPIPSPRNLILPTYVPGPSLAEISYA